PGAAHTLLPGRKVAPAGGPRTRLAEWLDVASHDPGSRAASTPAGPPRCRALVRLDLRTLDPEGGGQRRTRNPGCEHRSCRRALRFALDRSGGRRCGE